MAAPFDHAAGVVLTAPPPPPSDFTSHRMSKLQQMAARFEIRPDWISRLRQLEGFKICLLLDDSGSMASVVTSAAATPGNPYARQPTRWDELRGTVGTVVELATCLDPTGVDVYFLNRPPIYSVTSAEQVAPSFASPPAGFTPLSRAMRAVLQEKAGILTEKRMLLVIATDGQPTDEAGRANIPEFLGLLRAKPGNVFVSILACTDDEASVAYLNDADRDIPRVDVTDDFHSEREEILRAQGRQFHFSMGDYVRARELARVAPMASLTRKTLTHIHQRTSR